MALKVVVLGAVAWGLSIDDIDSAHRLAIAGRRPHLRLDHQRHVLDVPAEASTVTGEGTGVREYRLAVLALFQAAGRADHSSRSSASACSSQKRMSISRYIVTAVARCSSASSRSPVRR